MIRLLFDTTIAGVRHGAGSILNLEPAIEVGLITEGDADRNALPQLIGQSYAGWTRSSANAAGDADYVILTSVTVPGGTMGLNSVLRIVLDWEYTNSVRQKTLVLDWGGLSASAPVVSTSSGMKSLTEIANKNSLSIQTIQAHNDYGPATRLPNRTQNTANDVVIDIRTKWDAPVASETITLIGYSIWHYPGS